MGGVYYSPASGAGRRRVSGALEWRDVTNARDEDGLLIAVRRGKTNPDGETADVTLRQGRRLQGPGARQHARRHLARVNANAGNSPAQRPVAHGRSARRACVSTRPCTYAPSATATRGAGELDGETDAAAVRGPPPLEAGRTMRLEPLALPDTRHAVRRDANLPSQRAGAPALSAWRRHARLLDHPPDSGQRNRRLGPAAGLVPDAVKPFSVKALRPLGHARCAHAQARGDLLTKPTSVRVTPFGDASVNSRPAVTRRRRRPRRRDRTQPRRRCRTVRWSDRRSPMRHGTPHDHRYSACASCD